MRVTQDIASKWEMSSDGKKYTFTLNNRARFHNNVPIKASDVKFSWQRAVFDKSPEKYIFSNVVGYWDFISGKSQEISGIKAIDDSTLEVNLVNPNNAFILSLTEPAAAVVDRYQVINRSAEFGKVGSFTYPTEPPNGSGKFKLYEWVNHDYLTLGKNFNYFSSKPAIERLEFIFENNKENALTNYSIGTIDCALDLSEADLHTNQISQGKTTTIPLMQIYYLRLDPAVIGDIRIRRALINSVDFKKIGLSFNTDTLHYLTDISNYLSSGNPTKSQGSVAYDTYTASQLLTQAGYPSGKGLVYNLYYTDQNDLKGTALFLVSQWGARGINVKAVPLSKQDLNALKLSKTAGLYIDEWNAQVPSLEAFFYPQFSSAFGNGISAETDALVNDAVLSTNVNEENLKFVTLEKSLKDSFIIQPLFYKSMTIIKKPWVNQLEGNKLGLFSFETVNLLKH
jgi:ABC-type oligopeptide transport system substrate-binding subunit